MYRVVKRYGGHCDCTAPAGRRLRGLHPNYCGGGRYNPCAVGPILPDPPTPPVTTSPGGSGPKEYQGAQTAQTGSQIRQASTTNTRAPPGRFIALGCWLPFGYGAEFCWLRVKYLETISSSRPSNNREISRKAVLLYLSRFKKSGIEYVILAGSSLLTLSGAQSRYWCLLGGAD